MKSHNFLSRYSSAANCYVIGLRHLKATLNIVRDMGARDAQDGIDIYARRVDRRYHCLQAKRHQSFGVSKIRDAIDLFLKGEWAAPTERFTIAVQAPLRSTAVQTEIERQAARLKKLGINFTTLDGEHFTDELREHPTLVDDFFGRAWVEALLGSEVSAGLERRAAIARLAFAIREQAGGAGMAIGTGRDVLRDYLSSPTQGLIVTKLRARSARSRDGLSVASWLVRKRQNRLAKIQPRRLRS
jgi:hypothetical protein